MADEFENSQLDCPQCGEPNALVPGQTICNGCLHDNDAEDFDRCEGIYSW